eukprot:COSAG02_NODE_67_length_42609_cov_14.506681_37_plen_55_part_00
MLGLAFCSVHRLVHPCDLLLLLFSSCEQSLDICLLLSRKNLELLAATFDRFASV